MMRSLVSAIDFQTRATRAIRARRRATARIDPWFAVLVAAMLVVFVAFFAIGRATAEHSRVEEPSGLQAASQSVASAIRLSNVPPIAMPAIPKAPSSVSRSAALPKNVSPPAPLTREIPRAALLAAPVRQPQRAVSPPAEPVASPPTTKRPSPGGSPGGSARQAEPSSGSGSTFDSSG
jgi:hypothetical protein